MQMMNLLVIWPTDPDKISLHWSELVWLESSHANDESPDDLYVGWNPAASLHFHQFKGYILPTSQKPGSKWIKMFYFPFQIDKEGGGSLSVSLCHHQLAGDSQQDTMIGTWESFYLPGGVSALYDKTELASPKPHDPTHNRSFLSFPSLFPALDKNYVNPAELLPDLRWPLL